MTNNINDGVYNQIFKKLNEKKAESGETKITNTNNINDGVYNQIFKKLNK